MLAWTIISAIVALVGGFVLYFLFLKKSNDQKFKGFKGWMYDFLTFKKIFLEDFLKIVYLVSAIFITLYSFALIGQSPLNFILTLVVGNIGLRITFELILITLLICRNTTNISNKITNLEAHFIPEQKAKEVKEEKKEEKKAEKVEDKKEETKE